MMFVTVSAFHPLYQTNQMADVTLYLIRRVHNGKVYYLKEFEQALNKASWTQSFHAAHHFVEESKAETILARLNRKDCDIYTHLGMWSI